MTTIDISILIVNYNGASYLDECLQSILTHFCKSTVEVIVIDNDSSDHSKEVLKTYEDEMTIIYHPTNCGFAMGNNVAFEKAKGQFVFMLNNDTVLHDGVLDTLRQYLINHPHVGSVSPKLLNTDGSTQHHGSALTAYRYKGTVPKKVPFIIGAAVMMSAALYRDMGGLDDHYFFYNDDIVLCKRLTQRGYDIHYVPTVHVTHHLGLATTTRSIPSIIEGYRGSAFYCRKFYPYPIFLLYLFFVTLSLLLTIFMHSIPALWRPSSRAYCQAYLTVIYLLLTCQLKAVR